jgi:hypothetical protein
MTMNNAPGGAVLDPEDDAPSLTEAFFAGATLREGERLVRRGRPPVGAEAAGDDTFAACDVGAAAGVGAGVAECD